MSKSVTRIFGLVLAIFVLGLFVEYVCNAIITMCLPWQCEYGEGVTVVLMQQLAKGGLYCDPSIKPWIICPYTPLYIGLAAWLAQGTVAYWSGRLLSFVGMLLVMGSIVSLVQSWQPGKTKRLWSLGTWLGLLLLLTDPVLRSWAVLCRVDVLGIGLAMVGLVLVDRVIQKQDSLSSKLVNAYLGLASLALASSWFCKQSLVAAPLAVCIALWCQCRSRLANLVVWLAVWLGLGIWILNHQSNGWFLRIICQYTTMYWVSEQWLLLISGWLVHYLCVALLGIFAAVYWYRQGQRLWPVYWILSWGTALGVGRYGAYYNYFLELQVSTVVLLSLYVGHWCEVVSYAQSKASRWCTLGLVSLVTLTNLAGVCAPGCGDSAPERWFQVDWPLLQGQMPKQFAENWQQLADRQAFVADHPGPVIAEYMGDYATLGCQVWLCDGPIYCGLASRHRLDFSTVLACLAKQECAFAVISSFQPGFRYSQVMLNSLTEHYEITDTIGGDFLFVPRVDRGD